MQWQRAQERASISQFRQLNIHFVCNSPLLRSIHSKNNQLENDSFQESSFRAFFHFQSAPSHISFFIFRSVPVWLLSLSLALHISFELSKLLCGLNEVEACNRCVCIYLRFLNPFSLFGVCVASRRVFGIRRDSFLGIELSYLNLLL